MTNFEKIKIDFINKKLEEIEEIKKIPMSKIHFVMPVRCDNCSYSAKKSCHTRQCSAGLRKYLKSEAK